MTSEQLTVLKQRISEETLAVQNSIPYLTEESVPIEPSVALGRLTRMEAISEKGVSEEMLRKARQRLERLQNAADRMTRGSYGVCLRCNKEIAFERLNAIPEALVCVSCAEKPGR